jgi:hypothetical protein
MVGLRGSFVAYKGCIGCLGQSPAMLYGSNTQACCIAQMQSRVGGPGRKPLSLLYNYSYNIFQSVRAAEPGRVRISSVWLTHHVLGTQSLEIDQQQYALRRHHEPRSTVEHLDTDYKDVYTRNRLNNKRPIGFEVKAEPGTLMEPVLKRMCARFSSPVLFTPIAELC